MRHEPIGEHDAGRDLFGTRVRLDGEDLPLLGPATLAVARVIRRSGRPHAERGRGRVRRASRSHDGREREQLEREYPMLPPQAHGTGCQSGREAYFTTPLPTGARPEPSRLITARPVGERLLSNSTREPSGDQVGFASSTSGTGPGGSRWAADPSTFITQSSVAWIHAISRPSGDHAGDRLSTLSGSPSTCRCVPSAFMTYRHEGLVAHALVNAIRLPSGDHAGLSS